MDLLTRFQLPHCHIKDIGNSIFSFLMSSRPSRRGIRDSYQAHFRPRGHKNAADAGLQCRIWSKNGREMPKVRLHGIGTLWSSVVRLGWVPLCRHTEFQPDAKTGLRIILKPVFAYNGIRGRQSSLTTGVELAAGSVSFWLSSWSLGSTVVCCAMGSVLSCAPLVPCGGLCTMTTFEGMGFFMAIVFYE